MNVLPNFGERGILVGKTGTGKTTAMLKIAQPFMGHSQIQLLATKEDKAILSLPFPIVTSLNDVANYKFPEHPFVVYYPNGNELANPFVLDAWCQWVYERKNTVALIDELTQVARQVQPLPGFMNLYTRGRSQGCTVLSGTQRPRGLPPIAYTECENFYKFYLADVKDRKRVSEFTTPLMNEQVQHMHGFHYYNPKRSNNVFYIKTI